MSTSSESPLSQGDHFFSADSITFHYLVRGSGPLLIIQSVGWGMPGAYLWKGMAPHLEKHNTVLYFEPRGNGRSSKPADPSTMNARTMAKDIEHLRRHLALEALPALMGGSHAGAIVLRYAEEYPTRIARRKDDPRYSASVAKLISMMSGTEKLDTDDEFQRAMDVLLPWYFSDPSKADELRRHVAAGPTLPGVYAFQANFHDAKPENQLAHIGDAGKVLAKTLVIYGEEDAMCWVGTGRMVADGIRDARFVVIPGVGHFSYIENPGVFYGEVTRFIVEQHGTL